MQLQQLNLSKVTREYSTAIGISLAPVQRLQAKKTLMPLRRSRLRYPGIVQVCDHLSFMPEPHLNPDAISGAVDSEEALEQALEKVRQEARARALARKKANDDAISAHRKAANRQPRQQVASSDRRVGQDRRKKPRAGADDRRISVGGSNSESMQSRPILLIALLAAVIAAVGAVSIQLIHASTPALEGFGTAKIRDSAPPTPTIGSPAFNQPVTASLMRTQGWVLPSQIQTIDPALAKIRRAEAKGLSPEIALVPSLDMDVDPEQELAALTASVEGELVAPELLPPPPLPPAFGNNGFSPGFGNSASTTIAGDGGRGFKTGPRLALPPMQPFGGQNAFGQAGQADPFAGDVATAAPGAPQQQIEGSSGGGVTPPPSMLEDINRGQTPAPAPKPPARQANNQVPAKPPADPIRSAPSLARLQEDRCSRLGFFARVSCKDDIKTQYCEGRWNAHKGCERLSNANNF